MKAGLYDLSRRAFGCAVLLVIAALILNIVTCPFTTDLWAALGARRRASVTRVRLILALASDRVAEEERAGRPVVYAAVLTENPGIVQRILECGGDPDIADREHGATPLHAAAILGESAIVELLIDHGADVNATDTRGQTPLFCAVLTAQDDWDGLIDDISPRWLEAPETVVRQLLASGADPNIAASEAQERFPDPWPFYGQGPLHQAAVGGDVALIDALLEAGADVDAPGFGHTPLMLAASEGRVDAVRKLVESGADPGIQDWNGRTALMLAASEGRTEVVRTLVGLGAGIEQGDDHGRTALMLAAFEGQMTTVRELAELGADVDSQDVHGHSALDLAARGGYGELAGVLMALGAPPTVWSAAALGDAKGVGRMLEALEDDGLTGVGQQTPLHWAARAGSAECARVLVHAGFRVNAPDAYGRTPLHLAAAGGHEETINVLLAAGGVVDSRDHDGTTPLMAACGAGQIETTDALLRGGASADAEDDTGRRPINYTFRLLDLGKQRELARLLVAAQSTVNQAR